MIYGSVCSGIEAASVAWHPLGWRAAFLSEIEAFPRAVLAHHYPDVPLHGDFTTIEAGQYEPIELLVGGTPCQSFSVAGLRGGLADERGNLALQFLRLAHRLRPRWVVWENVPGVLSSNGGRDFGSILGGLAELGYGWAYRILDAQYFGLAQRRRRVFVVGCLGDWRRAVAVLFERASLSGHPAPRRKTGQGVAPTIASRPTGGGGLGTDFDCDGGLLAFGGNNTAGAINLAAAVNAKGGSGRMDFESETLIAHALRADGFDASEDGTGRGTPLVPTYAIQERAVSENLENGPQGKGYQQDVAYTLEARNKVQAAAIPFDTTQITSDKNYSRPRAGGTDHPLAAGAHPPAVAFSNRGIETEGATETLRSASHGALPMVAHGVDTYNAALDGDVAHTIPSGAGPGRVEHALAHMAVRRLTPRECERLQGFPDDYTLVPYRGKPAADGPRYKALGNSMAVPCMRWIGERIQAVESLTAAERVA